MESCFGEILCFQDREEDIKGLEEARDNFLEDHTKELDFLIILLVTPAPVCMVSITRKSRSETSVSLFYIVPIVTMPDALFNSGTNLSHLK